LPHSIYCVDLEPQNGSACGGGHFCIDIPLLPTVPLTLPNSQLPTRNSQLPTSKLVTQLQLNFSTGRNDTPELASRAFDTSRDGFVIAGGGGVLVLESLEHAKKRGARIYAELTGYGANSDGYDMVAPSGLGGQRCMKLAIEQANKIGGEKPVDYVNTHGTSTPVGDVMELSGIKKVFSEIGYQPNVGSTKSLSGHALGAAGVHEAIYTLLMMEVSASCFHTPFLPFFY